MADTVTPAIRSAMMASIRNKDTRPELVVRKALFRAGYRFRLHPKKLPGRPDIVLPKWDVAIFVHGCFWHMHEGCRFFKMPSSRREFWMEKLGKNRGRDAAAKQALLRDGWRIVTVWECTTRDWGADDRLQRRLDAFIRGGDASLELGTGSATAPKST